MNASATSIDIPNISRPDVEEPLVLAGKLYTPSVVTPNKKGSFVAPNMDQLDSLHEQLREEERLVLAAKLEELQKKKELMRNRTPLKKNEMIKIEDLKFTTEARRFGLPERIKKLPKAHPVRVLFEKGFQQNPVAFKHSGTIQNEKFPFKRYAQEIVKHFAILALVILVLDGLFYLNQLYKDRVAETRQQILLTISEQKYTPSHPKLKSEFKQLYLSNWLPDLKKLLNHVQDLGVNYEVFSSNIEQGSYMDYIKRHHRPFNNREALEWHVREMRRSIP
ncbi:MAG: hypothetical protein HQL93_11580 [Magnetococcales bacterium]|nr:hypothetical protein [Magnetococcales bacterium]